MFEKNKHFLMTCWVSDTALNRFKSYLSERKQFVALDGCRTEVAVK